MLQLRTFFFFFFFQAEDGIRDVAVTGVQTCALPISRRYGCIWIIGTLYSSRIAVISARRRSITESSVALSALSRCRTAIAMRSEEHTSELQSRLHLVCRLLLEKKKNKLSQSTLDSVE